MSDPERRLPEHEASAGDDPVMAADRLERALERIAAAAHTAEQTRPVAADLAGAREIAERLDALIARLRAALQDDGASDAAP